MRDKVALLREYSRDFVRGWGILQDKSDEVGLTYTEGHTLTELSRHGALTTGELAHLLKLDKSTVSRTLVRLEKRGWLSAFENASDRRQKPFRLTHDGERRVDVINQFANHRVQRLLELLEPEEREVVLQGMKLYTKALLQSKDEITFTIRPIQKGDGSVLAKIFYRVAIEYATTGPGGILQDKELDILDSFYEQGKSAYFVVEKEGVVLGGAGFAPLKGVEGEICELQKTYLLPEARGFGLGVRLVNKCLELAKLRGFTACYLETSSKMRRALALYRKLGFEELDGPMGDTGHHQSECWFLKEL